MSLTKTVLEQCRYLNWFSFFLVLLSLGIFVFAIIMSESKLSPYICGFLCMALGCTYASWCIKHTVEKHREERDNQTQQTTQNDSA